MESQSVSMSESLQKSLEEHDQHHLISAFNALSCS